MKTFEYVEAVEVLIPEIKSTKNDPRDELFI